MKQTNSFNRPWIQFNLGELLYYAVGVDSSSSNNRNICKTHYFIVNEKALGETQTLRTGCSKVEQKISPHRRPPSRGRGMAKI